MAELLLRPSGSDAALIERVLTPISGRPRAELTVAPRLVINAALAQRQPRFAAAARRAGIPVMVDPLTPYLQQTQHAADRWAALPFAHPEPLALTDARPAWALDLAEKVIAYQVDHGGTHLVTPYLHISTADNGWLEAQLTLYRATASVLNRRGIRLPVTAVVDVGWHLLDRTTEHDALEHLLSGIADAGFTEIALASSGVDRGAHPDQRLQDLLLAIHRGRQFGPVIAWNQGRFGELCIAAGALGYETGIGWRERSDTPTWSRAHRDPPAQAPRVTRPVYIDRLGHSIAKTTVAALIGHRTVSPDLPCAASHCCRNGMTDLLGDSRYHTIHARVRALRTLQETAPPFRWSYLAARTAQAYDLATRINTIAGREQAPRVDSAALEAAQEITALLRSTRRVKAA